ncbi:hypothetical protein [Candidatus Contubernalis alkaliaceticus]|uniref:hypothetical protein n=1 Tax=Candidatus Contubernalis alkaliaceticus TaxID=338645 RepID=UPI001F4C1784|nr:hypothetical protein [Candidatus Contubernalis alkalaceticus]UNC92146.1 hypothetical protein HUE98_08585 [Candidatus Contubernalis alkalaceticus]
MLAFILLIHYGTPWGRFQFKEECKNYFQEKYQEELVIERTVYYIPHGIYSARGYSQNYPKAVFNIGQDYKTKDLVDGYVEAVWNYNAKNDFSPIIEKVYPDRRNYIVELRFKSEGMAEWNRLVEMRDIPDYKEENTLEIGISMKHKNLHDEEIMNELERALKVINFIKEEQIELSLFSVDYKNKYLQLEHSAILTATCSSDLMIGLFDYK